MANITHEDNANPNPNPNPALPEEMIYEILSRLPAASLSKFQYVCKSWKSLISCPEFIKTHLSKSTNDPAFAHHRLLYIKLIRVRHANTLIPCTYMEPWSCSLNSLLNDDTVTETKSYCPGVNNYNINVVIGYCNGLFCLRSNDQIFLWNPFTWISTRLPKHEHEHVCEYGFCYDESVDDYKVFSVFQRLDQTEYNVSVYSSKSSFWRIIGDYLSGQLLLCDNMAFTNGAIHWLVKKNNIVQLDEPESTINIVSLDIKTETYRDILLPPKEESAYTTLDTFGESLLIVYSSETGAAFWVMKEYNVKESWTKLFTFKGEIPCYSLIKLLSISTNGDIMFSSGSTIILYNPKNNTNKKMLVSQSDHDIIYMYTYVESLVLPPKLAGSNTAAPSEKKIHPAGCFKEKRQLQWYT